MKELFSALDTPGGHMAITLMLIFFGFGILSINPPSTGAALAHDMVVGAIGVMFGAMKGNGGKQAQPPAEPPKP